MNAGTPDGPLLKEIEAHAIHYAQEVGHILLEHFHKPLEVQFKSERGRDPVTVADRHAEDYLKRAIGEGFPQHSILSEEGLAQSNPNSPFLWVLDPLDGTTNFMNGLPLFASSIGVLWKGQPVVGSISVPASHRVGNGVYHGRLGGGAYLNDERIEVEKEPSALPLSGLPAHYRRRIRFTGQSRRERREVRSLGSIALELALTASGIFQYAFFGGPKIWDVAAGVLLVKEAGGLALSRGQKGSAWLPLELFPAQWTDEGEPLEKLRSWSAPLIVGSPDIVSRVVKDIRRPCAPLDWLTGLTRVLKARK